MKISAPLRMKSLHGLLLGAALTGAPAFAQETPVETLFFDGLEAFEPAVMRISRLELLDPHVFANVILCTDVTATFNDNIDASINADGDGDGVLDSSPLLLMEPFAPPQSGRLAQGEGVCTDPVGTTECGIATAGEPAPFEARDAGVCRGPLAGTTSGYTPPVPTIGGPCFTDRPGDRQQALAGIALTLLDAVVAGSYTPANPNRIDSGLLRGFVRETDAETTLIPSEVPVIGGLPLAALLP
ncbi:MAG: hypothetical protein ACPGJE_06270, partial [Wenzhouxiangellaceae bacterium]